MSAPPDIISAAAARSASLPETAASTRPSDAGTISANARVLASCSAS
jgi:hypothetical protein